MDAFFLVFAILIVAAFCYMGFVLIPRVDKEIARNTSMFYLRVQACIDGGYPYQFCRDREILR